MSLFRHYYSFDPCYGHTLQSLLTVVPPPEPDGFSAFWTARYARALRIHPKADLSASRETHPGFEVTDIVYDSTDGFRIGGWLLTPKTGPVRRGLVVGHGYGGRDGPDADLPISEAVYLFLCFRGLSRSRRRGCFRQPGLSCAA